MQRSSFCLQAHRRRHNLCRTVRYVSEISEINASHIYSFVGRKWGCAFPSPLFIQASLSSAAALIILRVSLCWDPGLISLKLKLIMLMHGCYNRWNITVLPLLVSVSQCTCRKMKWSTMKPFHRVYCAAFAEVNLLSVCLLMKTHWASSVSVTLHRLSRMLVVRMMTHTHTCSL